MSHPVVEIWERSYWATLSFWLRRWNLFVGMSAIRQSYRIKNLSEALKVTKKGKGIDLFIFRRPHTWAIDQLGLSLASFQSSGEKNKRAVVVQLKCACISLWISYTTSKKWPNWFFFPLLSSFSADFSLLSKGAENQSYGSLDRGLLRRSRGRRPPLLANEDRDRQM